MPNAVTSELPDPHHPHIRNIVEEERLGQILDGFGVSANKLDDLIRGLSETIARRPEKFARESHTGWSRHRNQSISARDTIRGNLVHLR